MALSAMERKYNLAHGAMTEIAKRTGYSLPFVSEVVSGFRRNRRVEVAIARKLRMKVDDVFPPKAVRRGLQGAA